MPTVVYGTGVQLAAERRNRDFLAARHRLHRR
jgi:hypothetical protein